MQFQSRRDYSLELIGDCREGVYEKEIGKVQPVLQRSDLQPVLSQLMVESV